MPEELLRRRAGREAGIGERSSAGENRIDVLVALWPAARGGSGAVKRRGVDLHRGWRQTTKRARAI